MRLVFLGTPPAAATVLAALLDAGHDVALAVTRADARRSRRAEPTPSPVKALAEARGVPVSHAPDDAVAVGADLGVVVAYGRIIRPPLLGSMPLVNVHFSLLPHWRGAAPVERAILAGDERTGVCLMELEASLDTGPVYARADTAIGPDETAPELVDRLALVGGDLLTATLAGGLPEPVAQDGDETYAAKIEPEDRHLVWDRSAVDLARVVRIGRAWTTWRGKRLLVTAAAVAGELSSGGPGALDADLVTTGDGALRLLRVQPEGRAEQEVGDWLRGARPGPGERLGE